MNDSWDEIVKDISQKAKTAMDEIVKYGKNHDWVLPENLVSDILDNINKDDIDHYNANT